LPDIDFAVKTINDPVHGSIEISKAELDVVETPTFQRLRGLKQLGLADLAFPGATHTRFAHSLGVLHVASQMLEAMERNFFRRTKKNHRLMTKRSRKYALQPSCMILAIFRFHMLWSIRFNALLE